MKIIKNEIRPVGYATVEFNEAEIQSIISSIDELQMIKNRSMEDILGLRGEVYKTLKEILTFIK